MNNQIATRPTSGRVTTETDELIARLPKWLAYLVGAFPAAQTNKMTFLAYENAFAEVDPALMLTAVQRVADRHVYTNFPAIAKIRQAVEALEYSVTNRRAINANQTRARLIENGYRGEVDPAEWRELYRLFIAHKRLDGASALAIKYQQFTGEALHHND